MQNLPKRTKIIVTVLIVAAIVIIPSISIWFYSYENSNSFGKVNKLMINPYYHGKKFPGSATTSEFDFETNKTVNLTVKYELSNFTDQINLKDDFGSFTIGIFVSNETLNQAGGPLGGIMPPTVIISLLNANYRQYGFLGFTISNLSYVSMSSFGEPAALISNSFNPIPVRIWNSLIITNFSSQTELIHTLGTVYNINTLLSSTLFETFHAGEYDVQFQLSFYRILPWGASPLKTLNVYEPWVTAIN